MRTFRSGAFRQARAMLQALHDSHATIEFDMQGKVLAANRLFLDIMGYSLPEVVGQHHSMFVDEKYKSSPAYLEFWEALRRRRYQSARFKRFTKDGRVVWIRASYMPIRGRSGKPYKVLKIATDVTKETLHAADFEG
jgi:methyl-accepting chemotaxis protein